MNFSFNPDINKEYILKNISEEAIFSYYAGTNIKSRKLYCSKLRKDKRPTCSFYRGKSGVLYYHDFATGDILNCFSYVMKLYNCNYYSALKIIATDFGLSNDSGQKEAPKYYTYEKIKAEKQTFIQIESKEFTDEELQWWLSYGITKDILHKYCIYSCNTVFLNGNIFSQSSPKCPTYGYYFGKKEHIEQWKIYYPKRHEYRFIGNISTKTLQGYKQLPKSGKLLVITKSLKDCACLYSMGIPAVAPQSETQFISDTILDNLKSRFKYIVLLFDNDMCGVHYTNIIRKKYKFLLATIIPRKYGAKDISDFHKKYGRKKTIQFIRESLKYIKK